MKLEAGSADVFGACRDDFGVNFALFSQNAERVELCFYDASGKHEISRVDLPEQSHGVWHGYVPKLAEGLSYGYRVHGPYDPLAGHRFNASKLLLDPYAKKLVGKFTWHDSHYGFDQSSPLQDMAMDSQDNSKVMLKAAVPTIEHSLKRPKKPKIPWQKTIIYEGHTRGLTMSHPDIPVEMRGTFAGLSHRKMIDYLKSMGITSIELLPVQTFIDEHFLVKKGLKNYWGYNSLNFFSAQQAYASGDPKEEFRQCVDAFHDAGIEVILDVVYNHSCEGNHLGPTLSFRGIDNASYYHLLAHERRYYVNDSGCGNTLNISHPRVLQLLMDSLRYWVADMGVDGFRFDLAASLGRTEHGFSDRATLFQAIAQDPILATCKLIAEPWDLGPGGYQLGKFPAGWSEWNDRYRDDIRRYWRGDIGLLPDVAKRLHGSGDHFEHSGRKPSASINYICSHDGFTLRDQVSYNYRHNQANLENNADGHRGNHSCNHGVEGETTQPNIDKLRWQQQRNLLATLIFSQGTPMLQAGDEFGRSQKGNNNAYCQDNALNWLDWSGISSQGKALQAFVQRLLSIRSNFSVMQADDYQHLPNTASNTSIQWLNAQGQIMRDEQWHENDHQVLGFLLTNKGGAAKAPSYLLLIFNASPKPQTCNLPCYETLAWQSLVNTHDETLKRTTELNSYESGAELILAEHSLQLLAAGSIPKNLCTTN